MQFIFLYSFLFLFGLAMGSFLNAVVYRLQKGESFLLAPSETRKGFSSFFERSYCPKCEYELGWQDLIPLASFIFLKGKCRYCKEKISWQYPLVELITGLIFLAIGFRNSNLLFYGNNTLWIWSTFFDIAIAGFLVIIFLYDLKHFIIPDVVIYPAIIVAFVYRLCEIFGFGNQIWPEGIGITFLTLLSDPILSAFGASAFFLFIVLISRGKWMGIGDIKLAFLMGLFLGFPEVLVALFSAYCLGAIIGVGLIILGKKSLKSEVPFGPFLATGTLIAFFWGPEIIRWYLNFFTF